MAFIVLEGVDGTGKSTQIEKLAALVRSRGRECEYIHFPRFDAPYVGELIARFLRGELGDISEVDPYVVAYLYAADRADAAPVIRRWLDEGKFVIADRYVYSNIGFQSAKLPESERSRLIDWILELEFGYNNLPRPDINIFLDVPFAFTRERLTGERKGDDRGYLQGGRDIHEASLELQIAVRNVYIKEASHEESLCLIDCSDGGEKIDTPDAIFKKITDRISHLL